jgi:hypothetical protein
MSDRDSFKREGEDEEEEIDEAVSSQFLDALFGMSLDAFHALSTLIWNLCYQFPSHALCIRR